MRNAFFLAYCALVLLSGVRTLSMERLRNKAMFQPPFSSSPSPFQSYMEIPSKYPILMEIQDDTKTVSSQSSATAKTQQQTKDEAEKQQKALEAQKELERQKALEKMRVEAAKREKERLEALQQLVEDLKRKFNEFSVQIKEDGSQIGRSLMESLGSTLQKIRETMNEGYKTVLESISEGNKALQQLLKKTNEEVGFWIRELEGKINTSFCTLKELTVLILKYQKEDNERQIELLEKEIDILKASLPPPLSFCNRYIDCGTCNANPSCGWCSSKNKCIDGDNIGPLKEPCLFYNYDICTGFYCGNYTNCKSCLENPTCGWCDDAANNLQMCLERPVDFKACPSELWFHQLSSNNQCKDDVPDTILDLDKAMEKVKQKQKIQDRQTELEINARKLTEEERTIEELQEQIIHWKQDVRGLKNENKELDMQINATQKIISSCQELQKSFEPVEAFEG